MTAIWGPLGWMTLHSVSTLYPEQPTQAEKTLVSTWIDMFRDTITCVHCRSHFTEMLAAYKKQYPNMLNSRQDFAIAVFRMHNNVNKRLSKPIYDSVDKCMETLHNNIKHKTAKEYRFAYVNHIGRYWGSMRDVTGISALKKIQQMKKIEEEYFSPNDTQFQVVLRNDIVVLPADALNPNAEPRTSIFPRRRFVPPPPSTLQPQTQPQPQAPMRPLAGLRMQGGVFRLLK
jgi:hypothetical protein